MKNFNKSFCLFSSRRSQGFQMKKDQTIAGEKMKAADIQASADSSVGRAEDYRKADILRSLVRIRVCGWHEISEKVSKRNLIYFSKFKIKIKLVNQNRLTYSKPLTNI